MQKTSNIYKLKIIRDCHDIYVQSDPVLLADIFEDLRESTPGLAWITLLNIQEIFKLKFNSS